jgi:hypothetical protein
MAIRGLENPWGLWCHLNAVLQALFGVPAFGRALGHVNGRAGLSQILGTLRQSLANGRQKTALSTAGVRAELGRIAAESDPNELPINGGASRVSWLEQTTGMHPFVADEYFRVQQDPQTTSSILLEALFRSDGAASLRSLFATHITVTTTRSGDAVEVLRRDSDRVDVTVPELRRLSDDLVALAAGRASAHTELTVFRGDGSHIETVDVEAVFPPVQMVHVGSTEVSGWGIPRPLCVNDVTRYELKSIVVRFGQKAEAGHCYAGVYIGGSTWTKFSDGVVTTEEHPKWDEIVTERTRIAFYERRSEPIAAGVQVIERDDAQ